MNAPKGQPSLKDEKLTAFKPVVCLEFLDIDKMNKMNHSGSKNSGVQTIDKKVLAALLSPPHFQQSYQYRFNQHQSAQRLMGRHARTIIPDENTPVLDGAEKLSKKAGDLRKSLAPNTAASSHALQVVKANAMRSLRSSNGINIPAFEKIKMKTPSPPSTPSTRARSLGRNAEVKSAQPVAANNTRRLLSAAAPPKTAPRPVRTPKRKAKVPTKDDVLSGFSSDESSDSSVMCSPRKLSAMTPSTRTRSRIAMEVEQSQPTSTRAKTPTVRKSTRPSSVTEVPTELPKSVSRRKSAKPALSKYVADDENEDDEDDIEFAIKKSAAARRKGRPLLKVGTTAKSVKKVVNSSPASWSSEVDDTSSDVAPENLGEVDAHETLLVRALNRLHVSKEEFSRQVANAAKNVQNWAPLGREQEAKEIFNFVAEHLKSNTSGSLFVAGVPGIGKSATISAVLNRLTSMAKGGKAVGDLPRFRMVTVNGFHFATPVRFYCEVYRQLMKASTSSAKAKSATLKLKQRSLGPKAALESLNAYFTGKSSLGSVLPTVLVVDELDALVSASSANQVAFGANGGNAAAARRTTNFGANRVLYNLLEWASTPTSRLVIVAVANTLDLPERALPLRVVSRLGLHRLAFMPYTFAQLESIVRSRLSSLPGPVFDDGSAIMLAARKVAMASGDARRVLELCRLAVEKAIRQNRQYATIQDVVAASDSLSSATSRLSLVRQIAVSWRRVLTALVNICRMQCRDHGACLVRELHAELVDMWRDEGGFCKPTDVEVIRIVGQMVACGLLAAEDVSHLGIQAHIQLTMPLPELAATLASLLGTK